MCVRRPAAATALAGPAVALSAPPASAVQGGVVVVTPGSASPGRRVKVSASGCVTANPNAVGSAGEAAGTSTVFSAAKAGT